MRRDFSTPVGTVHRHVVDGKVLAGNPLGDPTARIVDIYVPHAHDGKGLPLLVDLVGFTGGGPSHTNWKNFTENVPERLDRLIASKALPPVVVAFPDCCTRLGGNQYINSSAIGRWDDFLIQEAVPFVEKTYGCGGSGKRGIFGKSSGGYGAIVHAMLHADFWAAAACHAGDMAFELVYLHDMPRTLRDLAKHGGIKTWFEKFFSAHKHSDADIHTVMMLAMAASYDPDPQSYLGVRLPVNERTCEIIPERWNNWLAWDPVVMAEKYADNLKRLKALFIDCGDADQYNILYGSRRLHRILETRGVRHTYEEFPDNHSSVDYRLDRSLPILAKALS